VANFILRDRDAIISKEGIIFRVYGYWHPSSGAICDVEYAPSTIYQSDDPRAPRGKANSRYFKFYRDEGLNFVRANYPQYQLFYVPLQKWLVGVPNPEIAQTRLPHIALRKLLTRAPQDELITTLTKLLETLCDRSRLRLDDIGVFGSLLHGFYHPSFSDIDLTIIGQTNISELLRILTIFYSEGTMLVNEFSSPLLWKKKNWQFTSLTLDEYAYHQRRKLIYGIYLRNPCARSVKIEFEPVKSVNEIVNEYDADTTVEWLGWIEATGRVVNDSEGPYIPSIYEVEIEQVNLERNIDVDITRIVSYVEEFRMQLRNDERFFVAGNLEKVSCRRKTFHQVTLTYGFRYYAQVLKKINNK
jgi:predicted nucleotidyltransferase